MTHSKSRFSKKNIIDGELKLLRKLQHCTTCGKPVFTKIYGKQLEVDDCKCKKCNCLFCRLRRGDASD